MLVQKKANYDHLLHNSGYLLLLVIPGPPGPRRAKARPEAALLYCSDLQFSDDV